MGFAFGMMLVHMSGSHQKSSHKYSGPQDSRSAQGGRGQQDGGKGGGGRGDRRGPDRKGGGPGSGGRDKGAGRAGKGGQGGRFGPGGSGDVGGMGTNEYVRGEDRAGQLNKQGREQFLPGGIAIVYEDDGVIIVDKPTGILTASVPGDDLDSVFREVKVYVRDQAKRRGTQVWIIHRLDKEASGLLVFAKTSQAFEWLKDQFRTKAVHRIYSAVVEGQVMGNDPKSNRGEDPTGTIQSFLVEGADGRVKSIKGVPQTPQQRASTASHHSSRGKGGGKGGNDGNDGGEGGLQEPKLAVTHYRVIHTGRGKSLLQVRLETGRKNQIRVHMSEMGHPIIGDRRYGSKEDPIDRLCLHAMELAFTHPGNGQLLRFRSPPPVGFGKLVGYRSDRAEGPEARSENGEQTESGPEKQVSAQQDDRPLVWQGKNQQVDDRGDKKENAKFEAGQREGGKREGGQRGEAEQSWNHVAEWYHSLIEERGSDHHQQVILPGTVRLLGAKPGEQVLDVACGQGVLCRVLGGMGVATTGVDSAFKLIESASQIKVQGGEQPLYIVGDARRLQELGIGPFDKATCVMALMNIEPLSAVFGSVSSCLKVGGSFVGVILHPAFRAPGQTSWGWDDGQGAEGRLPKRDGPPKARGTGGGGQRIMQFRRVDGYLSSGQKAIVMNPGGVSSGEKPVTTWTYHRPLQQYVKALASAGFAIDAIEEWPSLRASEPGPHAGEENRARKEIPVFMAIRAIKLR